MRLAEDAVTIREKFKDERFRNPSLFIDGNPYHEPIYPDEHFSEEQMIADVCAALLQNLVLGTTEYCLHFLDTEYQALEDYDR